MTFLQFIKSKLFLWQIVIAIAVTALLITLVMWCLSIYTQHGRTILVPTLEGMTVNQIEETLSNVGLEYTVIDSIHKKDVNPGAIVDQIPAAGKKVKKGRKIFLTINAYNREMTIMPQLVDYSLRNAQVVLETSGLKLEQIIYRPSEYNELVLEQQVNGQPIKAGTKIEKETGVTLIVGSGLNGTSAVVPNVIGQAYFDAIRTIKNARFSVGTVIFDQTVTTSEDSTRAAVYRQNPSGGNGSMEQTGTSISIWLTTDTDLTINAMTEEVETDEPNIFGE